MEVRSSPLHWASGPGTGISPNRILHPSVLVNLKQLRCTLALSPRTLPTGLNLTALVFGHQVAFPFQLLLDNPITL